MAIHKKAKLLITAMYIAGIIGLTLPSTTDLFKTLTPFNLLFSGILLIYFQEHKNKSFYIYFAFCILLGYFVEVLGVNTGLIFGKYEYTRTLGFEIWNVPPVIGINWFVLSYCFGYFFLVNSKTKPNPYFFALLSAIAMTCFDYIIEPVAIQLDMWKWALGNPPLSNYIGWFLVSFIMQLAFVKLNFEKKNKIALWLLCLQVLFFGIQ